MRHIVIAGLLLVALGCSDKKERAQAPAVAGGPVDARQKEPDAKAAARGADANIDRRIIYTANVELHVTNLDEARTKLDTLVTEVKGYVARSDEKGRAGGSRSGRWKVRVPVAAFHDFLARIEGFGELVSKTSDAQDVTEEFVDTEARVKNLKSEEVVLNKLLQEKAQSTGDLLAYRKQVSEVREQIERHEARLTNLSRLTAMSTVELVMSEDKPYIPPTAPTFGTSIGRTFGDSVESLEGLGKGLVLFLVAIAPWSPLIVLAIWLVRKTYRSVWSNVREVI